MSDRQNKFGADQQNFSDNNFPNLDIGIKQNLPQQVLGISTNPAAAENMAGVAATTYVSAPVSTSTDINFIASCITKNVSPPVCPIGISRGLASTEFVAQANVKEHDLRFFYSLVFFYLTIF